jgi:hypothetical protein
MDSQGTVPSNVIINGTEYSTDEAQELIETGRKTREYETQHNTKLDSIYPEYTRLTQERSGWATKEADYQKKLADFEAKQQKGVETPADVQQAREAARKLGIILDEDIKGKYLSKEELDSWYTSKRDEEKRNEQAVKTVLEEADRVAEEVKKSGSPVRFNKKAVLSYASAYGFTDLKAAYEDMYKEELTPWKEEQLSLHKGRSLKTLSVGSKKSPDDVRVTNDNVKELMHEALTGGK